VIIIIIITIIIIIIINAVSILYPFAWQLGSTILPIRV